MTSKLSHASLKAAGFSVHIARSTVRKRSMVAESIALCRTDASTLILLGLLFADDRDVSFIMEEISIPNDESTNNVLLKGSELGVEAEVTYHVHVA